MVVSTEITSACVLWCPTMCPIFICNAVLAVLHFACRSRRASIFLQVVFSWNLKTKHISTISTLIYDCIKKNKNPSGQELEDIKILMHICHLLHLRFHHAQKLASVLGAAPLVKPILQIFCESFSTRTLSFENITSQSSQHDANSRTSGERLRCLLKNRFSLALSKHIPWLASAHNACGCPKLQCLQLAVLLNTPQLKQIHTQKLPAKWKTACGGCAELLQARS